MTGTRDRNLPANLKLRPPLDHYDGNAMREAFRQLEQHYHLQLIGAAAGCPLFCGTGSPEGVVDCGQVGGIYEQTDIIVANGHHPLWIKNLGDIGGDTTLGWSQELGTAPDDRPHSTRLGSLATTGLDYGTVYGAGNATTGTRATAIGNRNVVVGDDSTGIGTRNTVPSGLAIGDRNVITNFGYAVGDQNTPNKGFAFGYGNQPTSPTGFSALAIGTSNVASKDYTVAIGVENSAIVTHADIIGGRSVTNAYPQTAAFGTLSDDEYRRQVYATAGFAEPLADMVTSGATVNLSYRNSCVASSRAGAITWNLPSLFVVTTSDDADPTKRGVPHSIISITNTTGGTWTITPAGTDLIGDAATLVLTVKWSCVVLHGGPWAAGGVYHWTVRSLYVP